jgi:hypothetical protein
MFQPATLQKMVPGPVKAGAITARVWDAEKFLVPKQLTEKNTSCGGSSPNFHEAMRFECNHPKYFQLRKGPGVLAAFGSSAIHIVGSEIPIGSWNMQNIDFNMR